MESRSVYVRTWRVVDGYITDEDSCSASDADSEGTVCAGGVMFEVAEEVG
jgi:hypothetical protein